MTRFNNVIANNTASTVEVGAGLLWDDVYSKLDGTGLNVVGARVPGIGVAGFILGGGGWSAWSTVLLLIMAHAKDIRGRRISMGLGLIMWCRSSSCSRMERFRLSPPKMKISGLALGYAVPLSPFFLRYILTSSSGWLQQFCTMAYIRRSISLAHRFTGYCDQVYSQCTPAGRCLGYYFLFLYNSRVLSSDL